MKKAVVLSLGALIGTAGIIAIGAHLTAVSRLVLFEPKEDECDEDIF